MRKKETLATPQTFFDFPKYEADFTNYAGKDKISFRRKRVNELRLRGYTNDEIAEKTGFSLSTIEKDLYEIRKLEKKWFEKESINDFCLSLHDSIILCDNVIEELQILNVECHDINTKLKILDKILEFEERKTSFYQNTHSVQEYLKQKKVIRSGAVVCE